MTPEDLSLLLERINALDKYISQRFDNLENRQDEMYDDTKCMSRRIESLGGEVNIITHEIQGNGVDGIKQILEKNVLDRQVIWAEINKLKGENIARSSVNRFFRTYWKEILIVLALAFAVAMGSEEISHALGII